ncbi:MAG: sensor histidine kinase [Bacteroidota bacterium]|nr:MAG: sensor histidine kinase [Bacteroidota bacterium]
MRLMNQVNNNNKVFSRKSIQHILFWILILTIEVFTYFEESSSNLTSSSAIWQHILRVVFSAIATYINYLILIPVFLRKSKFIPFVLCNVVNLVIFSFLVFIVAVTSYVNGNLQNGGILEHHIIYTFSILYALFFIVASTMFYYAQEWNKLKDIASKLIRIEKEKIESEHNALKAQLNPHFLFNTLNNIYALSLAKSDNTPKIVLKLSELMSYILYECKEEFVPVQKEIDFLKNYIELEKIRTKNTQIEFNWDGNSADLKIAPLLFIPFVENSFKHSRTDSDISTITIKLHTDSQSVLHFYCKNNKGNQKTSVEEKYKGVGIENVKKRLALLYHQNHQLLISDEPYSYKVELDINLK